MIKLYKIDYGIEYHLSKIEYIQDVNINKDDNFGKFKGAISTTIQSNNTGEILSYYSFYCFLFFDNLLLNINSKLLFMIIFAYSQSIFNLG